MPNPYYDSPIILLGRFLGALAALIEKTPPNQLIHYLDQMLQKIQEEQSINFRPGCGG